MVVEMHKMICQSRTVCSRLLIMKMKLAYKLFFAFLLSAAVIVGLLVGMQYYAMRNFAEYFNRAQLDKLDTLEERLIKAYEDYGDWEFLRHNRNRWRELLIAAGIHTRWPHSPPTGVNGPTEQPGKPPLEKDELLGRGRFWPRPHRPPHERPSVFRIGRGLTLFDADKNRVAGNPHPIEEHTVKPIESGNRIVGWLGLRKIGHPSDPLATAFKQRQSTFILLTGAAALLLTALVTLIIARQILRPVSALAEGTRAIISRRFQKRIEVRSKDELGQLAADFNTMAQTLEQYETMRQQWISDISHELRTPLAVLRGEIEALQDGVREANAETFSSLRAEVIRLGKLVDDLHLLAMADSESLLLNKTLLNPIGVFRETVKLFQQQVEERGLHIELDLEVKSTVIMEADADRLKQVFSNILENTLRHAHVPGTVQISAHCSEQTLTICFEDSGPGVPPESLRRLFDRLYRVDHSRSRELGGSGLGLAICKQIVERHGGTIAAENSALGGLSIKITFPLT